MVDDTEAQPRPIVTRAQAKVAGLLRYFTGKPCKHGHVSERFTNKGVCRECKNIWAFKNPEKQQASRDAWAASHPDQLKASKASWAKRNAPKQRAWFTRWAKANPEKGRLRSKTRKALRRAGGGTIRPSDIARLSVLQRGKCAMCKCSLRFGFHLDHIMPLKLGGTNRPSNAQLLCPTCNCSKGARHPVDFARSKGLLL